MYQIPETGFLRLHAIIGREEVTEETAQENRKKGKGPKRSRTSIPPIIPVKKSTWWAGVKSGKFPQPRKLGPRTTAWRCEDIRALIGSKEVL